MKFVVSDVAAETGGAITILQEFYEYVKNYEKDHEWIFLLSKPYLEECPHIRITVYEKVKRSRLDRIWYDYFEGKRLEKELHPDLFFSLQNTIFEGVKVPQAVYLHQPLPFQTIMKYRWYRKNERNLWLYQNLIGKRIKSCLSRTEYVVVQTKWLREAVLLLYPELDGRIDVIPPEIKKVERKPQIDWKCWQFFSPISDISYKNANCIYQACEQLEKENYQVYMTLKKQEDKKHIVFVGYLEQENVYEMYQSSTLIFPSYIETYGLPLAEARSMGTVVLASDCPFSREILDGYENAYFFDPFKPEELAALMKKVLIGEIVRKEVKIKNIERTSWRHMVERFEEIVKK